MSLHFAAARTGSASPVARILTRGRSRDAANDNGCGFADDQMLHAALRHFAKYGMHGARNARRQAEQAFFAGDREAYEWWRGICGKLDRQLARDFEKPAAAGAHVAPSGDRTSG